MEKTILKPVYSKRVEKDEALIGRIASIMGKSSYTIKRWLKKKSQKLTLEPITNEIKQAYEIPASTKITTTMVCREKQSVTA